MGLGSFSANLSSHVLGGGLKDDIGDLWNDVTGKTASRDASRLQMGASDKALALQKEQQDKILELNDPWRQAGLTALSDLAGGVRSGEFNTPQEEFNYAQPQDQFQDKAFNFDFQADPGYQFRQQQQQQAVERSAAAGGGLFTGATLSDLAYKSGQMASDEYGNAYNRARGAFENDRNFSYGGYRDKVADAQDNRNFAFNNFTQSQDRKRLGLSDRFNRLSTLAGLGDAATSRSGNAAGNYGAQGSDLITGAGNAEAAGRVGGYNNQRDTLMGLGDLAAKFYGGRPQ